MNVKLRNRKLHILYKRARFKVLYGGRGSGKSWGAIEALVYYAKKYSIRILCTREIQNSIKDSVHRLLVDTIIRYGLEAEFEITRDEIRHRYTGSLFIFAGLKSDPTKIKSTEGIDICYVEEAEKISQESLDILIPTIRKHNSEIWFVFNPNLPTDAVSQMFLEGELPPRTMVEKINYQDNPYVTDITVEDAEWMLKTDPLRYEHVYGGGYDSQTNTKLFSFQLIKSAIDREHDLPKGPIKAGLDVAREGDDKCVLSIIRGQKLLHIQEWDHTKDSMKLAKDVCDVLFKYGVQVLGVDAIGIGGPVADRIRQILPKLQVVDYKSSHKVPPKYEDTYNNRRTHSYYQLFEWLQTGCIFNHVELIRDLVLIEYMHDKKDRLAIVPKDAIKKKLERSTDYADSMAMAVNVKYDPVRNQHKSTVDTSWL